MNLTDHLQHIHKLEKKNPNYENYIKCSEVIPRCYTKVVAGVVMRLTGTELEEAKELHAEELDKQRATLEELKEMRNEIRQKGVWGKL